MYLDQPRLTCDVKLVKIILKKINYKVKSAINSMLNNKIDKKNIFFKKNQVNLNEPIKLLTQVMHTISFNIFFYHENYFSFNRFI